MAEVQRFNSITPERCHLLVISEPCHEFHIDLSMRQDNKWTERLQSLGFAPRQMFDANLPLVKPEAQVAVLCAEMNNKFGIRAANFGYDFSMRPEMMTMANTYVGAASKAWAYNGKPTGDVHLAFLNMSSEAACADRRSELAFSAADVVLSDQLRGGALISQALEELSRTLFKSKGDKRRIEDKDEYKARNSGVSPDYRDWFIGVVGMAHLVGFRTVRLGPAERDLHQPDPKSMLAVIHGQLPGPTQPAQSHGMSHMRRTIPITTGRGIRSRWGVRAGR